MKTIFLWVISEGWQPFDLEAEATKKELSDRNISIGNGASIGDEASIGNMASIGNGASIGYGASIGNMASIGNGASIGYGASIGNGASIGYEASIGNEASIGDRASIGNGASIGYEASIGNEASIGDGASIGNGASIGYEASIGEKEVVKKSLFITGTRHTVTYWGQDVIQIGCKQFSISEWEEKFADVGEDNNYTPEQIAEYGTYIQMIKMMHTTPQPCTP